MRETKTQACQVLVFAPRGEPQRFQPYRSSLAREGGTSCLLGDATPPQTIRSARHKNVRFIYRTAAGIHREGLGRHQNVPVGANGRQRLTNALVWLGANRPASSLLFGRSGGGRGRRRRGCLEAMLESMAAAFVLGIVGCWLVRGFIDWLDRLATKRRLRRLGPAPARTPRYEYEMTKEDF